MKKIKFLLIFTILLSGCKTEHKHEKVNFLSEKIPSTRPIPFKDDLVPDGKMIHKGMFSHDLKEYYYTISDGDFKNFEVFTITHTNGAWSEPESAFFDSTFDEHGMSFSPDGNTLYFSSTRPVDNDGIPQTWHLWKSDKIDGRWTEPVFVDIPNLRNKLLSHPTISESGSLYFHSSNLDYSEMDMYRSKKRKNGFEAAKKVSISTDSNAGRCTPFVSPKEDYLIFASIGSQLDLMISFKKDNGKWSNARRLNDKINDSGQGNPYITHDHKFLFFTTAKAEEKNWSVKWVNIKSELENNQYQ